MLAMPSGIPACPDTADRQHRLAAQLADMIPGAATILVTLRDPRMVWPHPHATVKDAAGQPIELSRTTAKIVARWILRTYPHADWDEAHLLNLATATLDNAAQSAAGRGC
jgi:hypothetical protein